MIVTLTLNPAIDRTIVVSEINARDITPVLDNEKDAAGKGINVAKVLDAVKEPVCMIGLLAGTRGEWIVDALEALNVPQHWVMIPGETRENIKVVEQSTHHVIELNEKGPTVSLDAYSQIIELLDDTLKTDDILVLSGSIPKGLPYDVYHTLTKRYKALKVNVVVDASNASLKEAISAHPTAIKPNRYELEMLAGHAFDTDQAMLEYAQKLTREGIGIVFISCGADGAYAVTEDAVYFQEPMQVTVQSTVGAGDAFVAGIAYGLAHQKDVQTILRKASAFATASVMTEGTKPGSIAMIDEAYKNIQIKKVG